MNIRKHFSTQALLKWIGIFLIPIPVAIGVNYCVIYGLGWERWNDIRGWLVDAYAKVGLHGVHYLFYWSSTTMSILSAGISYGVLVVAARSLLFPRDRSFFLSGSKGLNILSWIAVFFLAMPVTLLFLRLAIPPVLFIFEDTLFFNPQGPYSFSFTQWNFWLLVANGIPYAMSCLIFDTLLHRLNRKGRAAEANAPGMFIERTTPSTRSRPSQKQSATSGKTPPTTTTET